MQLYTTEKVTIPVRDGRTLPMLVIRHSENYRVRPQASDQSKHSDVQDRFESSTAADGSTSIPGEAPIRHEKPEDRAIGVLWLHGGGYETGFPKLVIMSAGLELVRNFNVTLFVPDYRLSGTAPYPAALEDAYDTLLYMKENSRALDIRRSQLMVGGESAGGGLTAALCLYARDKGEVNIAYQMPLYPMLDDRDTATNANNSGIFWNTRRNRAAWKKYLGPLYPKTAEDGHTLKKAELLALIPSLSIPAYAVPARAKSLKKLPPCYTFIAKGEPFYAETVEYIKRLKTSGVPAHLDEYDVSEHAFDMMLPFLSESKRARARFIKAFEFAMKRYSARN